MATIATSPKKLRGAAPRSTPIRLTTRDLDLFPNPLDDTRYELIAGALHVSKQPSHQHQFLATELAFHLRTWTRDTGRVLSAPGVVFTTEDAVAPDVVWVSGKREAQVLGNDGKLHGPPDLVVEVVSPGRRNHQRDLELKVELYSRFGVEEYWVVDWEQRTIAIYRRERDALRRISTLDETSTLESPLLPGFTLPLSSPFARLA